MIKSFANKRTAATFVGIHARRLPSEIRKRAKEKLDLLDAASCIDDLRVPPSNHLEILKGKRKGQYSIRINDQWRICFKFKDSDSFDVEIADYH